MKILLIIIPPLNSIINDNDSQFQHNCLKLAKDFLSYIL